MTRNLRSRGSAMLLSIIVVIIVLGLGGALMTETLFRGKTQHAAIKSDEAQVVCDAALEKIRLALKDYRNGDPLAGTDPTAYAWNQIFDYCIQLDGSAPGMGTTASADAIRADYLARRAAGQYTGTGGTSGAFMDVQIPTDFRSLFGANIAFGQTGYHVIMRNNDDLHGDGVDDDGDGDPWNVEDGEVGVHSDVIDGDRQAELVITATLPDGTQRQIEVLVEFPARLYTPTAAFIDNGTIQLKGAFAILGSKGTVHANEDVVGNGSANAQVEVSVNASGDASGFTMSNPPPGGINSGVTPASIPSVTVTEFRDPAKSQYQVLQDNMIILGADGKIRNFDGTLAVGYPFQLKNGTWQLSGGNNVVPAKVYYVEGSISLTGQGNAAPYTMSIIAEGSVELGGNVSFKAFEYPDPSNPAQMISTDTLAVAGQDVYLKGTGSTNPADPQYSGVVFANEQIKIMGNFAMTGAVIGANLTDSPGSIVTTSSQVEPDATLQGNPTISYSGSGTFLPPPANSVLVRSVRKLK